MRHCIITRYSVKIPGQTVDDAWMAERWKLFQKTMESVRRQTIGGFEWIVLCQRGRPISDSGLYTILEVDNWLQDIQRYLADTDGWLLTTRLDNDDVIAPWFVERLHVALRNVRQVTYIDYPMGYQVKNGRVYTRRERCNPFISYLESQRETVYRREHGRAIYLNNRVLTVKGIAWGQMLHSRNVANRLRGRICDHPASWIEEYI